MAHQSSGTGQGGKTYEDRLLAGRVRTLTLKECEKALLKKKGKLYEAMLLKLAGSVLPRINEHSGADGESIDLVVRFIDANHDRNTEGV